eukprot:snap_masked-scaffold_2-processed-gene-13.22-mRNA-1 protein AED:1.00 eAED:1.00 QI:0/-1/0/0/-1/1/1/0/182
MEIVKKRKITHEIYVKLAFGSQTQNKINIVGIELSRTWNRSWQDILCSYKSLFSEFAEQVLEVSKNVNHFKAFPKPSVIDYLFKKTAHGKFSICFDVNTLTLSEVLKNIEILLETIGEIKSLTLSFILNISRRTREYIQKFFDDRVRNKVSKVLNKLLEVELKKKIIVQTGSFDLYLQKISL